MTIWNILLSVQSTEKCVYMVTQPIRLEASLTNSSGSRVAGPKSRSRVQSRGPGSNVSAGENDLEFEVTE